MSRWISLRRAGVGRPGPLNPPTWTNNSLPVQLAFYYGWFEGFGSAAGGWTQQGYTPFTHYQPSNYTNSAPDVAAGGFYASADLTIINNHIGVMEYAGLDGAISSWWGQPAVNPNGTDANFALQLAQAEALGTNFKWCPYYEMEGDTVPPTTAQVTSDLNYLNGTYANHPNFLHIANKPVIFVYGNANSATNGYLARWQAANTATNNTWNIILKVYAGYSPVSPGIFGWHQYGPAAAEDHQVGNSFSISPGYWKRTDATPLLVRTPTTWTQNVMDMVASNERFQLVTTFNEWGEGTSVESAQPAPASSTPPAFSGTPGWETASGYGTYVDTLRAILVGSGPVTTTVFPLAAVATGRGVQPIPPTQTNVFPQTAAANGVGVNPASSHPGTANAFPHLAAANAVGVNPTPGIGGNASAHPPTAAALGSAVKPTVTPVSNPIATVPGAPTGASATAGNAQATVNWTVPGNNGGSAIFSYTATSSPGAHTATVGSAASPQPGATSVVVPGLSNGTAYTFTVVATNAIGNSAPSNTTAAVTPNPPPPTKPGIMVIMMENNNYKDILLGAATGANSAPFQKSLATNYVVCNSSWGDTHPSAPNYTAIAGGDNWGVTDTAPSAGNHPWIGTRLQAAGIPQTWYLESGSPQKHNPPQQFTAAASPSGTSITNASTAGNAMLTAMATADNHFYWLSPNLNNDTHDTSVNAGDVYLASLIPKVQATNWYKNGGIIIITYDEAYTAPGGTAGSTEAGPLNTGGSPADAVNPVAFSQFAADSTINIHGGPITTLIVSQALFSQSGSTFGGTTLVTDSHGFIAYNPAITHIGVTQAILDFYGAARINAGTSESTVVGGQALVAFLKAV